jgi:hypothetical protein
MSKLKHTSIDMPGTLSDVLLVEVDPRWCRQSGEIVPCDMDLPIGSVLARRANGDFAPYLLTTADKDAVAMLITPVEAGAKNRPCVVVRRGCVVAAANLHFIPAGAAADKKQAALASFENIGLVPEE